MSNFHEEMAASLLDQMLFSPSVASVLAETRLQLRSERIDQAYVMAIGQTQYSPAAWPAEQAAAFLRIHAGLTSGEFAQVVVGVGDTPQRDRDRTINQQRLKRLHEGFSARLNPDQNGADADGHLWWTNEILADRSTGQADPGRSGRPSPIVNAVPIPAGGVPLEVGVSKPSRTLLHLLQHGGVARWPYGFDTVTILLGMRPGDAETRRDRREVTPA